MTRCRDALRALVAMTIVLLGLWVGVPACAWADDAPEGATQEQDAVCVGLLYTRSDEGAIIVGCVELGDEAAEDFGADEPLEQDLIEDDDLRALTIMAEEEGDGYVYEGTVTLSPVLVVPSEVGGLPVTAIGAGAFEDCGWLEEVELPAGLRAIGERAFRNCDALRSVAVPEGLATVGSYAFADCAALADARLPEGVAYEGGYAYGVFENCDALASYRVPASLGSVCDRMFCDCDALASVELPAGLTSVGSSAFWDCDALASVALPDGMAGLGSYAFSYCDAIASLALPASLASFGDRCLWWDGSRVVGGEWVDVSYELRPATWEQWWALRSDRYVNLESTVVVEPAGAPAGEVEFEYAINPDGTATITGCKTKVVHLTIPSVIDGRAVTAIGAGAFQGDANLATVVMPTTLTTIEENAFADCSTLGEVLVPSSVSSIQLSSFASCKKLSFVCEDGSYARDFAQEHDIPNTQTIPLVLAVVDCEREVTFQEGGVTPQVSVKVGDTTLVEGRDYSLGYMDNEAAGIGKAIITALDGSGYSGEQYCAFSIAAAWERIAGNDRYATMAAISQKGFASSNWAVLATGANYPDALAATSLAGTKDCPIILTEKDRLSPAAESELKRLKVKNVFVVGGTGVVSDGVVNALKGLGITSKRVAGTDRQETSLKAFEQICKEASPDTVVIADGWGFADALSIGPWCFKSQAPILLANKGKLSAAQVGAVKAAANIQNVVMVGGTGVVSDDVRSQLGGNYHYSRLGGMDRYDTSRLIALFEVQQGMSLKYLSVATGRNYPDALSGAALCGHTGSVLVLGDDVSTAALDALLRGRQVSQGQAFGGEGAVSKAVFGHCKELSR